MSYLCKPVTGRPLVCAETVALAHGVRAEERAAILARARAVSDAHGCEIAWLAMDEGVIDPAVSDSRLLELLQREDFCKIANRDLAVAHACGRSGGLTVSATLVIAHRLGAAVAVTGAIGGVHRPTGALRDISADVAALARAPLVLVSAGIKPIVDAEATLEALESAGVAVIGLGHERAAFLYGNDSPVRLPAQLPDIPAVTSAYKVQRDLGMHAGILLSTRVPSGAALPFDRVKAWVDEAERAASTAGIHGAAQTPFMVRRMRERGDPHLTAANEAAFLNNIAVAAKIAAAIPASC
jgi:pseudouridine-5'-phosphate glycosidase